MKLQFQNVGESVRALLKKLGYAEIVTRAGQISFIRRPEGADFPRFHVYAENSNNLLQINLHLDMKAPTYGEGSAHGGEYEGEPVEQEARRIEALIASLPKPAKPKDIGFEKKKSWWGKLFGGRG